MLVTNASLYLPISEGTLSGLLDNNDLVNDLQTLSLPEIASIALLHFLPHASTSTVALEQTFAHILATGRKSETLNDRQALVRGLLNILKHSTIVHGYQLLADFNIALLDEESVKKRSYLLADGNWDFNFHHRHQSVLQKSLIIMQERDGKSKTLTEEQTRIYQEIKMQCDDHMHIQGYAGTGKSTLIHSLLAMLDRPNTSVLVLATFERQLKSLQNYSKGMSHVHFKTFARLATQINQANENGALDTNAVNKHYSRATMPDEALISQLGIQANGKFAARDIVRVVRATVYKFCFSGDNEIDSPHIPLRFASSFDASTRLLVLHHATELWKALHTPWLYQFEPQVRGYHSIKSAALNRRHIPRNFTHVLIDECHDLPKSVLQILDYSPQAIISLGDEYQNLRGNPQQRSSSTRHREITHSVRSAHQIESIVNPIIASQLGKTKAPFHGNRLNKIEISYYTQAQVPDQAAAILVNDTWGLLEWAQRIARKDRQINLLSDLAGLSLFVQDCIELYTVGTRARHPELFRFGSWQEVANHRHKHGGFQRINRALEQGYNTNHWQKTLNHIVSQSPQSHSLALVDDARNHEFPTIMVSADIVSNRMAQQRASIGSDVYVCVTRATQKLIAPLSLRNWIEDISAT